MRDNPSFNSLMPIYASWKTIPLVRVCPLFDTEYRLMKYLDTLTGKEVIVYPWSNHIKKAIILNNPERYLRLFEE